MTNLPWTIRLSYAVGHVLNDLCASVWFTYTLVYFKFGIQVPTTWAGSVVLVGQLADALATPVVGYLSDRTSADSGSGGGGGDNENANQWNDFQEADENHEPLESPTTSLIANTVHAGWRERFCGWCPRGRRAWYFGGNLMVLVSFPLLFGSPIASNEERLLLKMIYYLPITVIFQVGWASAQISHLATLTDLTTSQRERTFLTSLRHLFTVLSNLAVFLGTFFLFKLTKHISGEPQRNNSSGLSPNGLQPALPVPVLQSGVVCSKGLSNFNNNTDSDIDFGVEDLGAFRNLSFGIIAVGALMTLIFLVGTRKSILPQESTSVAESEDIQLPQQNQEMVIRSWKDWLRYPLFWMLGLLYMLVRLIINVSQSYLAVYLLHSLHLPKKTTALVPLTVYLTSIITLLIQKPILDRISREVNVTIGLLFTSAFCILANYPGAPVELIRVYSASGLLGIGCTIILVTALAMVSDLIGTNQQNGAFVYGCMSFTDKLANGIVIQLIEAIWNDAYCDNYYQKVESYGIGGFVTACFVSLVIFTIVKMKMNRDTDSDNMVS